jgi:glucose-6-phosphate isomerase
MTDLLAYLKTTDFTLNVISKSGTTLETNLTYKLIKSLMIEKYSPEELQKRIIITTDASSGKLKSDATSNGYKTFVIPNDIGGRYSLMTPAHLLPLALNINITNLAKGYNNGKTYLNYAYLYAINRVSLYQSNKYVENFVVYENNLLPLTEWLKQLFAETEGKNGKGIFPVSTLNTRDLHSLGQFIQEGTPILFETVLQVEKSSELKISDDLTLHGLNNKVAEAVTIAHNKGEVPINLITIPEINEYNLGELIYFFMLSAAFSGLMFGIDPFNQPGVEVYKKEEREMIKLDV